MLNARKVFVGFAIENDYGVPPIPIEQVQNGDLTGITPIPVINFNFSPNVDTVKRKAYKPSLSPSASLISKVYNEFSFTTEISAHSAGMLADLFTVSALKTNTLPAGTKVYALQGDGSTKSFKLEAPVSDEVKQTLLSHPELAFVKIHKDAVPRFIPYTFSTDSNNNLVIDFESAPESGAKIEVFVPNGHNNITFVTTPASTAKSATFYLILDKLLFVVSGARADMTLSLEANDTPKVEFKIRGMWVDPVEVQNVNFTCADILPPLVRDTFTVIKPVKPASYGGLLDLTKFELSLNNDLSQFESMNAVAGVGAFEITERNTELSIDGDMLDNPEFYRDIITGQRYIVANGLVLKSELGNGYMRFFSNSYVPGSIDFGERNGVRTMSLKGNLVGCDDEFTLVLSLPPF